MNNKNMTRWANSAIRSYKRNDPVMLKKYVSVKDVAYRRSSPERELWHAELTGEHDFYLMTVVVIVAAIMIFAVCKRMLRSFCRRAGK